MKIAFIASRSDVAQDALTALSARYGNVTREEAEVIVALGGDGFMLQALHETVASAWCRAQNRCKPNV